MTFEPGVEMSAVRLHPEFSAEMLGILPADHLNEIRDLVELAPSLGVPLFDELSNQNRLYELQFALLNWCKNLAGSKAEAVARSPIFTAANSIRKRAGCISVRGLADQASVSERKLQKDFRDFIGLSPKTYANCVRFNEVLFALDMGQSESGAYLSQDFGYFDQAHLITEFRKFAGRAPGEVMRERMRESDLYNTI